MNRKDIIRPLIVVAAVGMSISVPLVAVPLVAGDPTIFSNGFSDARLPAPAQVDTTPAVLPSSVTTLAKAPPPTGGAPSATERRAQAAQARRAQAAEARRAQAALARARRARARRAHAHRAAPTRPLPPPPVLLRAPTPPPPVLVHPLPPVVVPAPAAPRRTAPTPAPRPANHVFDDSG